MLLGIRENSNAKKAPLSLDDFLPENDYEDNLDDDRNYAMSDEDVDFIQDEYQLKGDACDVTLSVYPHRASLKNMPDHGGNRTYDLWNTSPMLCQLSYAVWSVRVCDISEQNL